MVPIISIVGKSDSGKTTFIEKLIPELNRRGYRVATIKHDTHGFEIDREGKDTWRHAQAGARAVIISSQDKLALIKKVEQELSLDGLSRLIEGVDLILTEGYKRENKPKIEVLRTQLDPLPLCSQDDNLLAIVADQVDHSRDIRDQFSVPWFHWDDIQGVADYIEKKYLTSTAQARVQLWVDGNNIPLSSFVDSIFEKTIRGMISSLKGLTGKGEIEIRIS
jgi:molybdopterin-guanine dinucleotide biosynthesis protein B